MTAQPDGQIRGMNSVAVWLRTGEVEVPVSYLRKTPAQPDEFGPIAPHPPVTVLGGDLHPLEKAHASKT